MVSRIQRERDFHNDRFRNNPTRSERLRGMTSFITLEALRITYSKIECYSLSLIHISEPTRLQV